MCVSFTQHPSIPGPSLTLGRILTEVKEEGEGTEGKGWFSVLWLPPSVLFLPPPSCPQDREAALEIWLMKEIKHVTAATIFQMGINFSHGTPARLLSSPAAPLYT